MAKPQKAALPVGLKCSVCDTLIAWKRYKAGSNYKWIESISIFYRISSKCKIKSNGKYSRIVTGQKENIYKSFDDITEAHKQGVRLCYATKIRYCKNLPRHHLRPNHVCSDRSCFSKTVHANPCGAGISASQYAAAPHLIQDFGTCPWWLTANKNFSLCNRNSTFWQLNGICIQFGWTVIADVILFMSKTGAQFELLLESTEWRGYFFRFEFFYFFLHFKVSTTRDNFYDSEQNRLFLDLFFRLCSMLSEYTATFELGFNSEFKLPEEPGHSSRDSVIALPYDVYTLPLKSHHDVVLLAQIPIAVWISKRRRSSAAKKRSQNNWWPDIFLAFVFFYIYCYLILLLLNLPR